MSTIRRKTPAGDRHPTRAITALVTALLLSVAVLTFVSRPVPASAGGYTWISMDVKSRKISGGGWMPYSTVTLTFSHPQTPTRTTTITHDMGNRAEFSLGVWYRFTVRSGDTVVATDGTTTKTLVVGSLALLGSNAATDYLMGAATPGATVRSRVFGTTKRASGVADADGIWQISYAGVYDLVPGTTVEFRELDDDWDETTVTGTLTISPDVDYDGIRNDVDNCPWRANKTQYDGDLDGAGARCDDVDRVWGTNRYGTAAAMSAAAFRSALTVFVASGENFPDALVAAAAGGYLDAPVLLTKTDMLPSETITELLRLAPQTIYLVGGPAAIDASVETRLAHFAPHVIRLSGADRYATAVAVARTAFPAATRVLIALGTDFPDALVAASAGGYRGVPVLLTRPNSLPQATRDALTAIGPAEIFVVGGGAAISPDVRNALAAYASSSVHRIAGPDRFSTAAAVADWAFPHYPKPLLAYGRNFPDALVAGAAAGYLGWPVLLVEHDTIPDATLQAFDHAVIPGAWVVGGTAAIAESVFNTIP